MGSRILIQAIHEELLELSSAQFFFSFFVFFRVECGSQWMWVSEGVRCVG